MPGKNMYAQIHKAFDYKTFISSPSQLMEPNTGGTRINQTYLKSASTLSEIVFTELHC